MFDHDGRTLGATNLSDGLGICAAYRGAAARTGAGIVEARARPLPLRGLAVGRHGERLGQLAQKGQDGGSLVVQPWQAGDEAKGAEKSSR